MAQLPPKAPSMSPSWPDFNHQRFPSMDQCLASPNTSSWVDEFLDFSSTKRGCHRRSISDSVAYLELISPEDANPGSSSGELERFDDEQLMSMFSDENSNNNEDNGNGDEQQVMLKKELKSEPHEEAESSYQTEPKGDSNDKIVDPKRIKRILANRQSAQRSRVRKLHYISELERNVTSLQTEVSVLSPRVAFLDHQRMVLSVDNGVLKQRIAALAQDKIFKDAHQEALKREIERLRQVYFQQNMKKMESDNAQIKSQADSPMDTNCPLEKEQLAN